MAMSHSSSPGEGIRSTTEGRWPSPLTVEACITVLYLDENELVQCVRRSIPVACRLECAEGVRCSCLCANLTSFYKISADWGET